jgi:hypothetical protein
MNIARQPTLVGTYSDVMAAHVARARLEAEGIRTFLLDEHLLTIDPLIAGAIGGVKLVVAAADADLARELLARPPAACDEPACPACGSQRIQMHHAGRRSAFWTILLLGVPIGRARAKARCEDCQHTWR